MTDSKEAKQTKPIDHAIPQALLDHVIATYKKPSDLIGENGLLKQLTKAVIEAALSGQSEAMISVRGKDRFVVMNVDHYNYLRECELEAALAQSRADIAAGRFVRESAQAHVDRIMGRTNRSNSTPASKKVKRAA